MNAVPVKVSKDRYIIAIFGKDNLVELVVHSDSGYPCTYVGYTEVLAVCKVVQKADNELAVTYTSEAMPRAEYDKRLIAYKALLAKALRSIK